MAPVADLELANREGMRKFLLINIHLFIKIDRFYCFHCERIRALSMIVDRLHFSSTWIEMLWRYAYLVASQM